MRDVTGGLGGSSKVQSKSGVYVYYNGKVEKVVGTGSSKAKSSSKSSSSSRSSGSTGSSKGTKSALKQQASKESTRKSLEIVQGNIQVVPDLDFRARNVYKISGTGSLFDGNYYVEQCTHLINRNGYTVVGRVIKVDKNSLEYYRSSTRRQATTSSVSTISYTTSKSTTTRSVAKKTKTSTKTISTLNSKKSRGGGGGASHKILKIPY